MKHLAVQLSNYLDLKLGQSTRITCNCGSGRTGSVKRVIRGVMFHCFRCHTKEFCYKTPDVTMLSAKSETVLHETIPNNLVKLPEEAIVYLWQRGIGKYLRDKYNLKWCDASNRIIITLLNNSNKYMGYIARSIETQSSCKSKNSKGMLCSTFSSKYDKKTDELIIVEDAFSAMVVGEHINTLSLNGTSISDYNIIFKYDKIGLWLDPDEAGVNATMKIYKQLHGKVKLRHIRSKTDPKYVDKLTIIKLLQEN